MEVNRVDIQWVKKGEQKCLSINIHGKLLEEIAQEAISKWKDEFKMNLEPGEKTYIICNCLNMTGYTTEARKIWQQTIASLKSQIECMWIVTDNKLFTMAAKTMGLMVKFRLKTAKSESEIEI